MKMKKTMCLLLSVCVLCGLLCACQSTPASVLTVTEAATTTTEATTTTTEATTTATEAATTTSKVAATTQNRTPTQKKTSTTKKVTTTKKSTTTTKANAVKVVHTALEKEIFRLVNVERESQGLAPVKLSDKYHACAEVRAKECSVKWAHTRPNGEHCSTVFGDLNLMPYGCYVAENIGKYFKTAEAVMEAFKNSPGHYKNILWAPATELAVAIYEDEAGDLYVSQLFISPTET